MAVEDSRRPFPRPQATIVANADHRAPYAYFMKWAGSAGTTYTLNVEAGAVSSTQPGGSIY